MDNLNIPSYNSLIPKDRIIRSIQELYRFIDDYKLEVDDFMATSSAVFRGTSAPGLTEQQFLAWADTLTKNNNDYCYWQTTDASSRAVYKRYKYNGTAWIFEYDVADPSSIPTQLSQLSDDATHRLVTDAEKATWNAKAEVGESTDPKTADTVYGAKAFATDADQTNAYFQQNLAVITALSEDPNAATTTVTTNPEWKIVYTDSDDRILAGKHQDNTWYFAADLDDILDTIIDGYDNP